MKTVITHSADFDGQFCREIAKKFLGEQDVQYIGWNFGDPPVPVPPEGQIYVMDLPVDRTFGFDFAPIMANMPGAPIVGNLVERLTWIDHHKSSIESHPTSILGYRIDGVAACRLAWQWFSLPNELEGPEIDYLPNKEAFLERRVFEPLAVRLVGEYDVWDHRGDGDLQLQFGLRSVDLDDYRWSLLLNDGQAGDDFTRELTNIGQTSMDYARKMDAMWLSESWHIIVWEGVKFLAQNSVQRGSQQLASKDVPETGHDALMLYGYRGKYWTVSMYHANHNKGLDLSVIATKYGGGGHRGACGFTCSKLPFMQ